MGRTLISQTRISLVIFGFGIGVPLASAQTSGMPTGGGGAAGAPGVISAKTGGGSGAGAPAGAPAGGAGGGNSAGNGRVGGDEGNNQPGGPGMMGPGGPGGSKTKKEYTSARKGAESFLNALKERSVEDLAEAVALRSQFEAKPTKQAMFKSILDKSADPTVISDLAHDFEGYQVLDQNFPKSTGSIGIIVGKTVKTDTYTRTILMRHEKAGWKVQDYSGERDFKTATNGKRRK